MWVNIWIVSGRYQFWLTVFIITNICLSAYFLWIPESTYCFIVFFDSKAIGWTTPRMSLELIDQFYIILCIINDFVTTFLTVVYRWYRCVYPWVIRCHQ